ncbi:MAG: histidine phosphatase family protein [Lachnospiraceae bacterium]|jgi:probable phosphoglycerate mutase|nr:histidine phosphatase family protein [Lachnospiraceae bacterium]
MIYLMRHGETDWNKERRIQGSTDIPLNKFGVHLARVTAHALEEIIHFDRCYSSPLSRAVRTAEIVISEQHNPPEIILEKDLRELSFGELEGKSILEGEIEELDVLFKNPSEYRPSSGGETLEELDKRTWNVFLNIINNPKNFDKNVLITAHGAVIASILNHIRDAGYYNDFWGNGVPRNCALTKISTEDEGIKIIKENVIFYDARQDWVDELKNKYGK